MKQLSLVALYGQKSKIIKSLIVPIWKEIEKSSLKRVFKRSSLNQIHSTIIGMEKLIGYQEPYNANHWEKNGEKKPMDFNKLYDNINVHLPLSIQIGGYKTRDTNFKSFRKIPFERFFQINFATNKVILMGWPVKEDKKTVHSKLLELRNDLFAKNNILHKYDEHKDNDFYLVIGELQNLQVFTEEELIQLKKEAQQVENKIRIETLEDAQILEIKNEDLSYVQYQKESLEVASSNAFNFEEVKNDPARLENLYR